MDRQQIKDRLAVHADAIDDLASSLRTMGHSAAIEFIEYRNGTALDYLATAEQLVMSIQWQITIAKSLIPGIEEPPRGCGWGKGGENTCRC